jgi:hypothetical protein
VQTERRNPPTKPITEEEQSPVRIICRYGSNSCPNGFLLEVPFSDNTLARYIVYSIFSVLANLQLFFEGTAHDVFVSTVIAKKIQRLFPYKTIIR